MKAIIVETATDAIDGGMLAELLEWAGGLGLDTKRATTTFVLAQSVEGAWSAHFGLKRQRDGRDYVEPGTNRVATDFNAATFPVAAGSWPQWFGTPEELPLVTLPALLESLAIAAEFQSQVRQAAARRRRDSLAVSA